MGVAIATAAENSAATSKGESSSEPLLPHGLSQLPDAKPHSSMQASSTLQAHSSLGQPISTSRSCRARRGTTESGISLI